MGKRRKKRRGRGILVLLLVLAAVLIIWRPAAEPDARLKRYASLHGISASEYPQSLVRLYENNRETEDFVFEYPIRRDEETDMNLSGIDTSKVPLLIQWDQRWGYRNYGDDMMGLTGCGPTCLSMVYIYLTGDTSFNPYEAARFSERNGFYCRGEGTRWAMMTEGGRLLGMDVTEIPKDRQRIYDNLDVGNPIIASVVQGHFTSSGHFIVLTGRSGDEIYINDPNSIRNSRKSWNYDEIESEFANLWVFR